MTPNNFSEVFVGLDVSKAAVDVCLITAAGEPLWCDHVLRETVPLAQLAERLGSQARAVLEAA